MKKLEIIKEINNYEAKLVWEIDKSKFYSMIGSDTNGTTYWLWYNLEEMKKKYLIELLDGLKKENKMETMTTEKTSKKKIEIIDDFTGEMLIDWIVTRLEKKDIRCYDSAIISELRKLNFVVNEKKWGIK